MRVGTLLVHAGARLVQNEPPTHLRSWLDLFRIAVVIAGNRCFRTGSEKNCVGIVWVVTVRSSRTPGALGNNPLGRLSRKLDVSHQSKGVPGLNRLVPWRKRVGQMTCPISLISSRTKSSSSPIAAASVWVTKNQLQHRICWPGGRHQKSS